MAANLSSGKKAQLVDPWEISATPDAPELNDSEDYHIFISYSNTDSAWARGLIRELETAICGLKACFHERDFLPGKTIVENMSDAIQRSQKTLLVLSKDFVRSRWCQMEANLSVFRDCSQQKPVIPLMLEHCSIPLHLTHLTYLDTKDIDFFAKLVAVICSPNQSMKNATLVPYQPISLYSGKALLCLSPVNEHTLQKWEGGTFSENIPDALSMVFEDQEGYSKAIQMINEASTRKVQWNKAGVSLVVFFMALLLSLLILCSVFAIICSKPSDCSYEPYLGYIFLGAPISCVATLISITVHVKYVALKMKLKQMSLAAGLANCLLVKYSVLVGCESRVKLHFLYISLTKCRKQFVEMFKNEDPLDEEMFRRALHYYSSGYACCVVQKHFPFASSGVAEGHMQNGPCFCQYVSYCLELRDTDASCCSDFV